MYIPYRTIAICCLLTAVSVCLFSCEKPKQGKVVVSQYELYTVRVSKSGFELCAKGKVKNVGAVDVKNVAITGNCLSCNEVYKYDGSWVISPDIEKSAEQQPVINYIPIGEEEEFIIKNIAYAPVKLNQLPKKIPEKIEVVVISFETVSE
jgi:hypothetical protein